MEQGENNKGPTRSGKNKDRLLTDDQIITRVLPKAREAVGWFDSKLSRERERVLQLLQQEQKKKPKRGKKT